MNAKTQILFVDDDALILSCYERLLGRHFTIETALGPERALQSLQQGSFAIVATDLRMPGMSGLELLQKVKEGYPDTVGLLLSGNPELDNNDAAGQETCVFRQLEKPCPTADLIRVIEEALEQYRLNAAVGVR